MKKCIAIFTKWDGEIVEQEVKREWVEDIAMAVEGQFTYVDRNSNLCIKGSDFYHVDIFEVEA